MFVWQRGGMGAMFCALHRIIAMSVFRTAMCFAGFVFYLVFKQFFGSEPERSTPMPPAIHQQVPSLEQDNKLELMNEADQPA